MIASVAPGHECSVGVGRVSDVLRLK